MTEISSQAKRPQILAVDDDPIILDILLQALEHYGCDVDKATSGAQALQMAESSPPDLILLDIGMSEMNGYQVCERLKQNPKFQDVPVIFLSGLDSTDVKVRAFQAGGVDYVTKPFQIEELHARVGTHLNLCSLRYKLEYQRKVDEKVKELLDAQQATIFALAKLAEQRDEETGSHLDRVRQYCRLLAEWLSQNSPYAIHVTPDFIECIQHASPLHDIGKVAIPDHILLKPGKLTSEEFEIMKTHTVVGAENMQVIYNRYAGNVFIGMGIEIALYHHERWDGTGYPDGLVGTNIPLSARIMALADFYDALHSDRCYRKGFEHAKVKAMILEGEGTHFDPEIVKAFLALEAEFDKIIGVDT